MGSKIQFYSVKWAILATVFLTYNISSLVSNCFDTSQSLLAEKKDSNPAIWDKKDGYSTLKGIENLQDRQKLELNSRYA
jgi:lipopolysaccharide export LptBFGC system permease protein LptF